jgi:hypothetical protein
LLHLGVIPPSHKKYDEEMASERVEVRTRYDAKLSETLRRRAVSDSDYCLAAKIGELNLLTDGLPEIEIPAIKPRVILPTRRRPAATPDRITKKKSKTISVTPQKKTRGLQLPLTPPVTPQMERTVVVYDMTLGDHEVVEIICID